MRGMTRALAGTWLLDRTIVDLLTGERVRARGAADIDADGARLTYREAVTVDFGGRLVRATRGYRFHDRGAAIDACFDDGRAFFTAAVDAGGRARALHRCGDDRYEGRFVLGDAARWTARWRVSGGKSLVISTTYVRAPATLAAGAPGLSA